MDPKIVCPECRAPMALVCGSRNGDFYSCSRYPVCRGTRPAVAGNDGGTK
ncbi:topoisomerase DNA-binding C4 zinc finger domain-containing protein [Thiobacillus sp.]